MARRREQSVEHLLRRAGFGASQAQVDEFADIGLRNALAQLIDYDDEPDDVDDPIGKPGSSGSRRAAAFLPAANITDARQRWLFRMVHSRAAAPGEDGALLAQPLRHRLHQDQRRLSAASKRRGCWRRSRARTRPASPVSSSCFREHALGNFRDLLVAVAQGSARCSSGSTGGTNVRSRPQENFARELMELFTMGVGTFEETDVYAGARVFTGWNLARVGGNARPATTRSTTRPNQHDTAAKEFTFPIYPDGNRRIAGAIGCAGHAGRHRPDQRRRASSGDRPAAGAQAVQFFVNEIRRRRIRR